MEIKSLHLVLLIFCACTSLVDGLAFSEDSPVGHMAEAGEFPWHVALYNSGPRPIIYKCGGTIISSRWVLTTAACCQTYEENLVVHSGTLNKTRPSGIHVPSRVIYHPEFNGSSIHNNIALIELKYDIKYHLLADQAALPEAPVIPFVTGQLAGWGFEHSPATTLGQYAQRLRATSMDVMDTEECRSLLAMEGSLLGPDQFCAAAAGTSACSGDQGGSFVVQKVAYGIIDRFFCSMNHFPTIFIDVFYHREWIRSITGI